MQLLRPLPDERPRQSVANLIGRFENHTKRQAPPSSSVISHDTGDSLNNEQKEKREWPPRSVSERIASLESFPLHPRPSLPASHSAPQPSIAPMSIESRKPPSAASDHQKELIQPEPKVDTDAKPVVPSSPPRSAQPTVKSTKVKGSPAVASKSLHRTVGKPPALKQPFGAPAIQPLKPQHTGLSTASTASVKRPATTPTPIKTPVRSAAVAASSTRPKTPSSGLFAPTAASLAKSRSAQAASTSTPVKKITLTSSASDRLSKPTAASLSKARATVPPVPQLTRSNTKSAAVAHVPTKSVVKAKAAGTPAPVKKPLPVKTPTITSNTADALVADDGVPDIESDHSDPNDQYLINGHSVEEHTEDPPPSEGLPEQIAESALQELSGGQNNTDKVPADVHAEQSDADATAGAANREGFPDSPPEAQPYVTSAGVAEPPDSESSSEESKVLHGDDIENIVNLLESASIHKVRPISIASIPDEVHEIPDEE